MSEPDDLAARLQAVERAVADVESRLARLTTLVDSLPAAAPPRAAEAQSAAAPAAPPPGARLDEPPDPASRLRDSIHAHALPLPETDAELETVIAGRWLNRVGLIAVGLGVTYFLKYAIDNAWIGPASQVAIGLVIGAALLASVPWFTRRGYTYFADGLSGLGAALLYAAVWAGGSYYELYSLTETFGAMAIITAALVAIAIRRDAQAVAVIALVGGFASPRLVNAGHDVEIGLFAYLSVLDAALLPIAYARRWTAIEWPAFVFTQLYFWSWFSGQYQPAAFTPTAAFVLVFFAVFLVLPALRAQAGGRIDAPEALLLTLNAVTCLLAFTVMLWHENRWDLTLLALALAAVHLVMSRLVPAPQGESQARWLFAGLALTLATLAIPIRLDGHWITMAWAVEGSVLVWTGVRTDVRGIRLLGLVLLSVSGFQMLAAPASVHRVILNGHFETECVTVAAIAVALRAAARRRAPGDGLEAVLIPVLGVGVNVLALWALTFELRTYFELPAALDGARANVLAEGLAISLLWTVYAVGLLAIGVRKALQALRWQALALFGVTTVKVFVSDTASLQGFYRIGSAVALGVVLLVVSFVYQRRTAPASAVPGERS